MSFKDFLVPDSFYNKINVHLFENIKSIQNFSNTSTNEKYEKHLYNKLKS